MLHLVEKEKQYSIKAISMERALKEMILLRQEDKRKKLDFIKKQRCEALKNGICQIVSFVCFVTLSILSQWLVVTYKKVEIAWYWQTLITIFAAIVSQAIPIWRSLKFGSSDIKNEFALLFRIGRIETKKKLIAEYRKQVKAPSLMKAYNKLVDDGKTEADCKKFDGKLIRESTRNMLAVALAWRLADLSHTWDICKMEDFDIGDLIRSHYTQQKAIPAKYIQLGRDATYVIDANDNPFGVDC